MCQPDLATGCPDDWLNIILVCVCEGVSGWKLHLNLSLSKADWSPKRGWASSNMLKAWMELKGRVTGNSFSLPDGLQAGTLVFSCLQTQAETLVFLWSWACQLSDWISYHQFSWFSGRWTWSEITPLGLLGLQLLTSWPPELYKPILYNKSLPLSIYILLVFTGEPWLIWLTYHLLYKSILLKFTNYSSVREVSVLKLIWSIKMKGLSAKLLCSVSSLLLFWKHIQCIHILSLGLLSCVLCWSCIIHF